MALARGGTGILGELIEDLAQRGDFPFQGEPRGPG